MMKIERLFISPTTSILEAMRILDEVALQIILIVDENQKLLGVVTDGDVRRAILRQVDLSSPVQIIMNIKPTTFTPDISDQQILSIMKKIGIRQIPIVNNEGRVVDLKLWDHLVETKHRDNIVVLMAGGAGKRMGELTKKCPKPLLSLGQKPILQVIIEKFVAAGFHRFYVTLHYKAKMIQTFLGDGKVFSADIQYIEEKEQLGTAGALSLLPADIQKPLIVMNADIFTDMDFNCLLDFHMAMKSHATLCVSEYDFQVPYGVVSVNDHQVISIDEKPTQRFFVNAGIYVVEPKLLKLVPKNTYYNMPDLFEEALKQKMPISCFPMREYWVDMGTPENFEKAMLYYQDQSEYD